MPDNLRNESAIKHMMEGIPKLSHKYLKLFDMPSQTETCSPVLNALIIV